MYFPIGWPKYLRQPQSDSSKLQHIGCSYDRMFFSILSEDTLSVWYCKPAVQIVSYTESQKNLDEFGLFCSAEWKPDSSAIAVVTSKCCIIFFLVELDLSVPNHQCLYVTQEGRNQSFRREASGTGDGDSIPAIKLSRKCEIQIDSNITSCLCIRDELAVSSENRMLLRIRWNGTQNERSSFRLQDISIAADFQQSRACSLSDVDGHVVQMEYSPIIGGYVMVMSTGRAIFIVPPSNRRDENAAAGIWAPDLLDASCLAINHRYRLMTFGCKSGIGVAYVINELEGTLEATHRLQVSSKDYADISRAAGSVRCMKWTPDGTALAMFWEKGGFSLWSVFGSLLVCTLGGDYSLTKNGSKLFPSSVKSMEWGLEGYQLWMICSDKEEDQQNMCQSVEATQLMQLQFVKSALTVNPCMSNHEHVFLQGEDKLYINIGQLASVSKSSHEGSSTSSAESHILAGSRHWQVIPISHSYLANNWPIRYAAIDRAGQCVAVAGKTGLAHYALFNRKWKLFGNETQERDLVVSGGMVWWKDFICIACYNIISQRDEIRCYPRSSKLDNTFVNVSKMPSQVLLLNTFRDILIVFCVDSHIMLFSMERKNTQPNSTLEVTKIQEVALNNYIPHPVCVTGVALTSLRTESVSTKSQQTTKEAESLLLNVAGKLLMFQRDRSGPKIKDKGEQKFRLLPFCPPSVVATNVENLWTVSRTSVGKLQLTEALWLGCGSHGMKVWLPLFPRGESDAHNFISKRIMLPFRVDIYPLAVLFEEAVILGAASDAMTLKYASPSQGGQQLYDLPYSVLERTSQIYLHHILRQLLRRNLGVHALDLAQCCTELSYFPHVLELLLHEVLEAEATSKEPIPDPLLPRVVAFIQEFPEFLQTVVHCARKTEVALWPYLFSTIGNPKDLFEECLINGRLETAASYLIILQNLEKPMVSRQHATLLLDAALETGQWELAQDLVRFLKAIDPSEADAPPLLTQFNLVNAGGYCNTSPPITPPDRDGFTFSNVSNVSRMRSASVTSTEALRDVPKLKEKTKLTHTKSDNQMSVKRPSPKPRDDTNADQVYIDQILNRHARKLLSSNRLRDLGYFAANIENFHLVAWMKIERLRSAKVEDFVGALRDIHNQFEWPMPVLSFSSCQQLKLKTLSTSSLASLSLLDDDLQNPSFSNSTMLKPASPQHTTLQAGGTLKSIPSQESFQNFSDDVMLQPQLIKMDGKQHEMSAQGNVEINPAITMKSSFMKGKLISSSEFCRKTDKRF
ncbi:hypothetical protein ACJMK2_041275 [Sinanodonta woodiana]|uniref:Protein RIC1 homolog n=1 Tax=Sinanodonta woodiana TaxID=1069815 RepID=A0ABD3W3L3_SINWO